MTNDDMERNERITKSTLEDLEQKYHSSLEQIAMLEAELAARDDPKAQIQRLKDELRETTEELSVANLQIQKLSTQIEIQNQLIRKTAPGPIPNSSTKSKKHISLSSSVSGTFPIPENTSDSRTSRKPSKHTVSHESNGYQNNNDADEDDTPQSSRNGSKSETPPLSSSRSLRKIHGMLNQMKALESRVANFKSSLPLPATPNSTTSSARHVPPTSIPMEQTPRQPLPRSSSGYQLDSSRRHDRHVSRGPLSPGPLSNNSHIPVLNTRSAHPTSNTDSECESDSGDEYHPNHSIDQTINSKDRRSNSDVSKNQLPTSSLKPPSRSSSRSAPRSNHHERASSSISSISRMVGEPPVPKYSKTHTMPTDTTEDSYSHHSYLQQDPNPTSRSKSIRDRSLTRGISIKSNSSQGFHTTSAPRNRNSVDFHNLSSVQNSGMPRQTSSSMSFVEPHSYHRHTQSQNPTNGHHDYQSHERHGSLKLGKFSGEQKHHQQMSSSTSSIQPSPNHNSHHKYEPFSPSSSLSAHPSYSGPKPRSMSSARQRSAQSLGLFSPQQQQQFKDQLREHVISMTPPSLEKTRAAETTPTKQGVAHSNSHTLADLKRASAMPPTAAAMTSMLQNNKQKLY